MYTYTHIYIYTHIHINIYTYRHIHRYTYIHKYTHTYIHIYIYSYIHILRIYMLMLMLTVIAQPFSSLSHTKLEKQENSTQHNKLTHKSTYSLVSLGPTLKRLWKDRVDAFKKLKVLSIWEKKTVYGHSAYRHLRCWRFWWCWLIESTHPIWAEVCQHKVFCLSHRTAASIGQSARCAAFALQARQHPGAWGDEHLGGHNWYL